MANDLLRGRQTVAPLTNKSGGGVVAGDVVILDSANASSFTTTTTAALATRFVGVALEMIANNASGRVCLFGYVPQINLSSSASLGHFVATHTVAKQAAPTGTQGAGVFGQVLGTGTTPAAILFGYPQQAGGAGTVIAQEVDGTPSDAFDTIIFPNGTLTDNADGSVTYTPAGGGGGAMVFIAEQILGSNAASVTFSSISGTYRHLLLVAGLRSTYTAATVELVALRLNGDTGATQYGAAFVNNTTAVDFYGNESSGVCGYAISSHASNNASAMSGLRITIIDYARTSWWKPFLAEGATPQESLGSQRAGGMWKSTAAVTSLTLLLRSGGNFQTGSVFTLYGIEEA